MTGPPRDGRAAGALPASLELRHLRYFLAVAAAGSFSRAAEAVYVGQPALSAAIRQLETAVGERLFVRGGRRVQLTPAGVAFRRSAELTLAGLERGVVRAREAARPRPLVRLFFPYEGNDTARAVLREVREQHPDTAIERLHGGSRAAVAALLAGRADAAVGGAFDLPEGVVGELVRHERLVAVVPVGSPLARAATVALADLAREPVYLPAADVAPTWTGFVDGVFARAGVAYRTVGGDSGGPVVFADVVAAGLGVSLAVRSDVLGPGVETRPISDEHASYPWSVLWLAADPGAGADVVRAAARRAAARHGWLSPGAIDTGDGRARRTA